MIFKSRRFIKFIFLSLFLLNVLLALITNVSTAPTQSDEIVFRSALRLQRPTSPLTFDDEIKLIRQVHSLILETAPDGDAIPDYSDREPEDLLRQKSGQCYDRARTLDKVFSWLGFQTRHIYLLYPDHPKTKQTLSFFKAFMTRGTLSHAVTEVKTQKGWLVVDSNSDWISLTISNRPVAADEILFNKSEFSNLPKYFGRTYYPIRGLYSRRGQLYRPYLPYPQLNWPDFITSLF